MEELATILRKEKESRGFLDFDTNEAKILVDEFGKPYDIVLRERGKGENLIEDFMIAANETVASHIFYMGYPFVYRIHEVPDDEKVNELVNKYSLEANQKLVGKTVKVLIEDVSEKDNNKVFGYTDTMKLVNIENGKEYIGEIVDVKITDAKSFSLDGIIE